MNRKRNGTRSGVGNEGVTPPTPEWLSTTSAAAYIDYSAHTLRDWRKKNMGPPFERNGTGPRASVRYNRHKLDEWMARDSVHA